jgi:preprotein translocase subunit SecG
LTRATAILAALFFATSLGLTVLARINQAPSSILQHIEPAKPAGGTAGAPAQGAGGNLLDQLKKIEDQRQATPPAAPPEPPAK